MKEQLTKGVKKQSKILGEIELMKGKKIEGFNLPIIPKQRKMNFGWGAAVELGS